MAIVALVLAVLLAGVSDAAAQAVSGPASWILGGWQLSGIFTA